MEETQKQEPQGLEISDQSTYTFQAEVECPKCAEHFTVTATGVRPALFASVPEEQGRLWARVLSRAASLEAVYMKWRRAMGMVSSIATNAKWERGMYVLRISPADMARLHILLEDSRKELGNR